MGVKFNALSKQMYKMIRVSIISSGNTSTMTFDRMERKDDILNFFRGNMGSLRLKMHEDYVAALQVDDNPIAKFAGRITYCNGVVVDIYAM